MRTKVILELGCNHNGDVNLAKQMIDDAAKLGVWAVKLQKRDLNSIPKELAEAPRDPSISFGSTYLEHRRCLELSIGEIEYLLIYAEKLGVLLGVTVFDLPSLKLMGKLPLAFIKLPSQLYLDAVMNEALAQTPTASMASVGMHSPSEIYSSPFFGWHNVTFYCRSMYPFQAEKANLIRMVELKGKLRSRMSDLGYSSHDVDGMLIPLAVAMGAKYVERHYTLDKGMKGFDHRTVSSTYNEMQEIIDNINTVEEILGTLGDELDPDELKIRKAYRGF